MFLLRRPSDAFIQQVVDAQRNAELTYPSAGLTRESGCPAGFYENRWQSVIGSGSDQFERAKSAISQWQMLDFGWLEVVSSPETLCENGHVATLVRTLGVYSLNVARIVYVEDESPHRFGFGYGTLPCYPLSGEERFTINYDVETQQVSYEIFSFSRPAGWLTRLGLPYIRYAQQQFCRDSSAALEEACRE